jgi:hypothetical protein
MEENKMYNETKKYLKELSVELRKLKNSRKKEYRENNDLPKIELDIQMGKYQFRHHHIALCEIYGTCREKIEKPSQFNLPNELYIKKIKEKIIEENEKLSTLRDCA